MARITQFVCDLTGEKFDEGEPGSAHVLVNVVKPDDYETLSKTDKAPFVVHRFDLSPAGVAKLREMGGTRGQVGRGRPSSNGVAADAAPAETPAADETPAETPAKAPEPVAAGGKPKGK